MPVFEYYDFENYILCYYYPYMTLACQGGAFLTGVLYRCGKIKLFWSFNVTCFFVSFLNYRYWNLLGTMMAGLCLPVDVLIFYKEKALFENIMNLESLHVWCLNLGTTGSGWDSYFPCLGLYTFLCHDLWCCLPWEADNHFGKRWKQIFQENSSFWHLL